MADLPYTHLLYVRKYFAFKNDYELFIYGVNTNDIYHTIGEYLTRSIEQVKRIDYTVCTQKKIDYWKNNGYDILTFKEKHKVDTERHAHWVDNGGTYECSNCGDKFYSINIKYCSNCGCKMDKTHVL